MNTDLTASMGTIARKPAAPAKKGTSRDAMGALANMAPPAPAKGKPKAAAKPKAPAKAPAKAASASKRPAKAPAAATPKAKPAPARKAAPKAPAKAPAKAAKPAAPKAPKAPSTTGRGGYTIDKDRPAAHGKTRPSANTTGGKAWAGFEAMQKKLKGELPTREQAKEIGAELALNPTSVVIAYYRWRKFLGVRGRQ